MFKFVLAQASFSSCLVGKHSGVGNAFLPTIGSTLHGKQCVLGARYADNDVAYRLSAFHQFSSVRGTLPGAYSYSKVAADRSTHSTVEGRAASGNRGRWSIVTSVRTFQLYICTYCIVFDINYVTVRSVSYITLITVKCDE